MLYFSVELMDHMNPDQVPVQARVRTEQNQKGPQETTDTDQ